MTPTATRPVRLFLTLLFALLTVVALGGCASSGGGSGDSGERTRGTQNQIIEAELSTLYQLNAYQAVERLRPRWLRQRLGRVPQVVVGGSPGQGLGVLRSIRAVDVREMRFMSASDATTRYGTGYDGGAIVVELKGGE